MSAFVTADSGARTAMLQWVPTESAGGHLRVVELSLPATVPDATVRWLIDGTMPETAVSR